MHFFKKQSYIDDKWISGCQQFKVGYRELFHAWEMWPSPHSEEPVGSKVW